MAIFGRPLRTAPTWRSSVPLRQTLCPIPPPPLCHPTSHFLLSVPPASEVEIQVPKSARKPKAVVVVAVVLSGLFAGATLIAYKDLAKLCDAAVADQAKIGEFAESVKRRELSIQSTDRTLANALNWSILCGTMIITSISNAYLNLFYSGIFLNSAGYF